MSKIGIGLQSYQLQIETILNIVFKILALLHCRSIHMQPLILIVSDIIVTTLSQPQLQNCVLAETLNIQNTKKKYFSSAAKMLAGVAVFFIGSAIS